MKKQIITLLSVIFLLSFSSCKDDSNDAPNTSGPCLEVRYYHCNLGIDEGSADISSEQPDTLYTYNSDDSTIVYTGFNEICCHKYVADSYIKDNTIIVEINCIDDSMCHCDCFYDFTFTYNKLAPGDYDYRSYLDGEVYVEGKITIK